jgi:nicotinamidase-related amidase
VKLDVPATALVLVDFTNGLLGIDMHPYTGSEVLASAVRLADEFRASGGLVVLTANALNGPPAGPYQRSAPPPLVFDRDLSALAGVTKIENWSDLPAGLGPRPGDHFIRKTSWSAFYATDLDFQLRRRGITTLVLGGIATNFGAEGTGRDARALGYNVIFAADAMRAITAEEHAHALRWTLPMIGRVTETASLLDTLRRERG